MREENRSRRAKRIREDGGGVREASGGGEREITKEGRRAAARNKEGGGEGRTAVAC